MITNSVLDIEEHVRFFGGVAPVLALPFHLDTVTLGMQTNLFQGTPRSFPLFFCVPRVMFNGSEIDGFVETHFALAPGATKTFGRRSFDGDATAPFHYEITRLGKHFQAVK